MPFCDSCGCYFPPEECRERTKAETEVLGSAARSWVVLIHLCRSCDRARNHFYWYVVNVVGVFFLGVVLLYILGDLLAK
jgi:hypothetical protein